MHSGFEFYLVDGSMYHYLDMECRIPGNGFDVNIRKCQPSMSRDVCIVHSK